MTAKVDITKEVCPMTYVRVKLAIEALDDGATLEVLLRGPEPLKNVPRSATDEGHEVLSLQELPDGNVRLTIKVRHQRASLDAESVAGGSQRANQD